MKSMMKAIVGAGVLAGLAQVSFANGYNYRFHSTSSHQTQEYVDFSAVSPHSNHQSWPKATIPTSGGQLRVYYALQLQGSPTGTCYSYQVQSASQPATNTDLVAYVGNTMIDDDGPGGSRMPFFKVWVTSGYNFKISSKNSYNDQADWNLVVNSAVMSQSACQNAFGGPAQPMVNSNGQVIVGPTTSN